MLVRLSALAATNEHTINEPRYAESYQTLDNLKLRKYGLQVLIQTKM